MTILVTGAAGFIGSHVSDRLLNMGETVIGIDSFTDYYDPAFKEQNLEAAQKHPRFTLLRNDICNLEEMRASLQAKHIDCMIHLAASVGVRASLQHPLRYQKNNIEGTYAMFELARRIQIPRVIFASSSSVYGNQTKTPFSEDDNVDHPISPYAATKKACELIAATYHHLYGIDAIGLRFFTVYGERGRPDMSPYLFADALLHGKPITLYGDGFMQRDFTYIDDIVAGVCASLNTPPGYAIINLGNAHPISLNDYLHLFEKITGKTARINRKPVPSGDVQKTYADIRRAKNLLGWQPTTSLEEGLTKFVAWFQKHRMLS